MGQGQLNTQLGADGGTLAVSRNGAAVEFNDGACKAEAEAEAQAGFTDSLRSLAPEGCMLVVGFTGGEISHGQGQPAAAEQHRGNRCRLGSFLAAATGVPA